MNGDHYMTRSPLSPPQWRGLGSQGSISSTDVSLLRTEVVGMKRNFMKGISRAVEPSVFSRWSSNKWMFGPFILPRSYSSPFCKYIHRLATSALAEE
jgi:hypothetical protein